MRYFRALLVLGAFATIATLNLAAGQTDKSGVKPIKARVDQFGDPLPVGAIARLGTTRYRHGGLDLLGFTPDDKALIYHGNGELHFMDVASGKGINVIRIGEASPRGLRRFGMETPVALSGDTKVLAIASQRGPGNSITVFDATTGKERKHFSVTDLFQNGQMFFDMPGLALTEDGRMLAVSGGFDHGPGGPQMPLVWVDTTTGQRLYEINPEKDSRFGRAQFSRDGRQIICLQLSNNKGNSHLRIFDAMRGTEVRSLEVPGANRFLAFELRPDGQTLLATNGQGPIRLFDFSVGKELKEVRAFSDAQPGASFMQSRDGKQLFVLNRDKIHQWDVETGKEIRKIEVTAVLRDEMRFGGQFVRLSMPPLALSHNGKQLAFSGAQSATLFDTATGKKQAGGATGASVSVVRFAPDSKGLIVGNSDHGINLWDVSSAKVLKAFARFDQTNPKRLREFDFFSTFGSTGAFSQDGKLLAVSLGENGVGVWDAAKGSPVKRYGPESEKDKDFFGPDGLPYAFAFAPTGSMLAVSTPNGTIKLWDANTGKQLRSWTWQTPIASPRVEFRMESAIVSMAFSPDGKTLAGCGVHNMMDGIPQTSIILWETASGKERLRLNAQLRAMGNDDLGFEMMFMVLDQMALSTGFSPDGKHLMVGTFTGLHLLDASTGKDVVSYTGRSMIGRTATFSPDGKLLFVGKVDGMLRVMDATTGRVIHDFAAHSEPLLALTISADGKTLASGSNDSTVLLWDVAELVKHAVLGQPALSAKEMEALWNDLAGSDAAKAYQAINVLTAAPASSVPFIKTHLKPVMPVDQKVLDKLVEDLNSPKFPVRDKATIDLEKLGDLAGPTLKKVAASNPPLEVQQRIDKLLGKLNAPVQSPQTLQALRAIETLERIGSPDSLAVLADLGKGAGGHRVTEDARESLQRLELMMKKKS